MKYATLYADANGISHWSDVEVVFFPVEFAPPAPPIQLSPFVQANQYAFFRAPADWFGDWHPAPARQIFFFLEGELEVMSGDGERRRFPPGSILCVENTFGQGHVSRTVSDTPVLAAVAQLA
ncbi:MAG: cupin domain-containing protein [Chloroflexales bacterium]|nr:cupin domain-containing protein [Chloroflexales bacterium]